MTASRLEAAFVSSLNLAAAQPMVPVGLVHPGPGSVDRTTTATSMQQ